MDPDFSNDEVPLRHVEVTESTNDDARAWAADGAAHGAVVWAEEQRKGRGRRGAEWVCPVGEGLAFSIVLRPEMARAHWPRIALICGLAVCRMLEGRGIAAEIKWPNDVMVAGRKICGILVEADASCVIAGIGINANVEFFPNELAQIATSMRIETGCCVERVEVLMDVRRHLLAYLSRADADFPLIREALRERCYLTGKNVRMTAAGSVISGKVRGIGDSGELLLEQEGKLLTLLQADEIRVVS